MDYKSSPMVLNNNRQQPSMEPKLSLQARFDDLCRANNALLQQSKNDYKAFQPIVIHLKETRKRLREALQEINDRDARILKLESEKQEANNRIQQLRMGFAHVVKDKENLQKNYNDLKKKMNLLRELMESDENKVHRNSPTSSLTQLMAILNNCEAENRTEDDSNDGLLFDKSDDNINMDDEPTPTKRSKINPNNEEIVGSRNRIQISNIQQNDEEQNHDDLNTIAECEDENSVLNNGFILLDEKMSPEMGELQKKPSTATIKSNTLTLNRHQSARIHSRLNVLRYNSKLEPNRLDSRPHKFEEKKAFKKQFCTVCTKSIGFCQTIYVCTECRGIVHKRCKDLLPKPCLPYLSGSQAIKKMISMSGGYNSRWPRNSCYGGKIMIGDFTTPNTRPCVPALMIHCCNEIDRRIKLALEDPNINSNDSPVTGLYRVSPVEKEARELRNKILEAKNGIPNLTTIIDVHIICSAVKLFLRDLDDSILTTVLWNDFVRAADHVVETIPKRIDDGAGSSDRPDSGVDDQSNSDDEDELSPMQVLKSVVLELPIANRDSLAFFMLHLRNVANSERVTKMTTLALSNIFAPTIVGNSEFRQISSSSLMKQTEKQVLVMQALFLVDEKFWSGLLKDQDFYPFKEKKLNRRTSIDGAAFCSKLAKISSSNLRSLLNNNDNNIGEAGPSKRPYNCTRKSIMNNNYLKNANSFNIDDTLF